MKTLPFQKILLPFLGILSAVVIVGALGYTVFKVTTLDNQISSIKKDQDSIKNALGNSLFDDHLQISSDMNISSDNAALQTQINDLLTKADNVAFTKIQQIQTLYADFNSKLTRNKAVKIDDSKTTAGITTWGDMLLKKDYDNLITDITAKNAELEASYKKYLATLPPPPAAINPGSGYSYQTVKISQGTFGVYLLKFALSDVKVVTAAANSSDCKDGCPTKSLEQHIKDNNGFAGMNGTYFCPPDYSSCKGKVNSFDYAFYKSSSSKWLNKNALSWGDTGLATFNGHSATFYTHTNSYGGGSVTAGISNYPTLLHGGKYAVEDRIVTSYQKLKGTKGAIGIGKSNLYLAIITNASVSDAAYVMQALGAQDALNLDGGGSSAMYLNGHYILGPGRSLPNAVVLVK
ncbi:MAG TPA: phosphodiester glycosidase family protein [Candidatus Saccharimonadales bacterium]|nr:phosphodiester glycosidase family protein [Candidatus Saccharimonadales bacterium]